MEKIEVIDTWGLDEKTKDILSKECFFVREYTTGCSNTKTTFCEIKNIDGEIVRIFPERIKLTKIK